MGVYVADEQHQISGIRYPLARPVQAGSQPLGKRKVD